MGKQHIGTQEIHHHYGQPPTTDSSGSPGSTLSHNIPRSGVVEFVGRLRELEKIDQHLAQGDKPTSIVSVKGMGGIGKTELALQYAQSRANAYPGGTCWVNSREGDIGAQILNFAQKYLDVIAPNTLEKLSDRVDWVWSHWPKPGKVLVIFDDVTNWDLVEVYMPPIQSHFDVLLTSRRRLAVNVKELSIDTLVPEESEALITSFIGSERFNLEKSDGQEICRRLGHLPLALELIGRYLERYPELSFAELLIRLEKKGLTQEALAEKESGMTGKLGVAAAFELSWQELNDLSKELACQLSLFALAPIPWKLARDCFPPVDDESLEKARNRGLCDLSLLESRGEGFYEFHQLIWEYLRNKWSEAPEKLASAKQFAKVMVGVAKTIPERPTLTQLIPLLSMVPHLEEVCTHRTQELGEDLTWPFAGLARIFEGHGLYAESLSWHHKCLKAAKQKLGTEHQEVATSLNNIAVIYKFQGRYEEAEPMYAEALEITRKRLGRKHLEVAISLNNIALLYEAQGRYEEAASLLMEALTMRRSLLGSEHPDVATSLNNLAFLYESQGRYEAAELLYTESLELMRKFFGAEHPDVATSLNNLAELYRAQGRYEEAEPLYVQALEMFEKLLGQIHPNTLTVRSNFEIFLREKEKKQS